MRQDLGICHVDEGALRYLANVWGASSLVDVGCGTGGQVAVAARMGWTALGIDRDPGEGPWTEEAMFRRATLVRHDYRMGPYVLAEPVDVAWCVEFMEYIPTFCQANVWPTLECARVLVITWAPPGHGGVGHIAEEEVGRWVPKLCERGWRVPFCGCEPLRSASTMEREFIRERGWLFIRERA